VRDRFGVDAPAVEATYLEPVPGNSDLLQLRAPFRSEAALARHEEAAQWRRVAEREKALGRPLRPEELADEIKDLEARLTRFWALTNSVCLFQVTCTQQSYFSSTP